VLVTGTAAAYDDECIGVLASIFVAYMVAVVVAADADNTGLGGCTAYDDECIGVAASKVDAYMAAVVVAADADNTGPDGCTAAGAVEAAVEANADDDEFDMLCGWILCDE
jgi:hypothetical protein